MAISKNPVILKEVLVLTKEIPRVHLVPPSGLGLALFTKMQNSP
jgi:hypothetical protein